MVDAQKYYHLEKINVEWCAQNNYYNLEKINVQWIMTSKKKCRVVWPSHHRLAQNTYDLEKINVEWSGPLTFVSPKIIKTSKK